MSMESRISSWLRCYRCWSRNLEVQVHYDAIRPIDPETGIPTEGDDEIQESVVQCLDCMHDQPHLTFERDRVVPIEDRWERMVAGTPWVASCTVTVEADQVEACAGPEAVESLTFGAFGLKALEPERVTARQIEAARRAITRHIKRQGRVWIRVFPDVPVSKKPTEVRMGKGKGATEFWVARVAPGRIMFEIDGVPQDLAREALTLAAAKLPIKTRFIQRIAE